MVLHTVEKWLKLVETPVWFWVRSSFLAYLRVLKTEYLPFVRALYSHRAHRLSNCVTHRRKYCLRQWVKILRNLRKIWRSERNLREIWGEFIKEFLQWLEIEIEGNLWSNYGKYERKSRKIMKILFKRWVSKTNNGKIWGKVGGNYKLCYKFVRNIDRYNKDVFTGVFTRCTPACLLAMLV